MYRYFSSDQKADQIENLSWRVEVILKFTFIFVFYWHKHFDMTAFMVLKQLSNKIVTPQILCKSQMIVLTLIMLMIVSHKCAATNVKVAFIRLKWAIYNNLQFVQLGGFAECDFGHNPCVKSIFCIYCKYLLCFIFCMSGGCWLFVWFPQSLIWHWENRRRFISIFPVSNQHMLTLTSPITNCNCIVICLSIWPCSRFHIRWLQASNW